MGSSFNSEDIKDLENTLLRRENIIAYKKKYQECKDCLDCIPSFFITVKYYYNGIFYE
tara:strand:+ start:385 stop:558 length:174 start_codon:yes stop_codon:yes gene_type:complete